MYIKVLIYCIVCPLIVFYPTLAIQLLTWLSVTPRTHLYSESGKRITRLGVDIAQSHSPLNVTDHRLT